MSKHTSPTRRVWWVALLALGCGEPEIELSAASGTPDPSVNRDLSDGRPFAAGDRIDVGAADVTFGDPGRGDIGHVLAMPGDLDGDGFDDIVIGNVALPGPTSCVGESCASFRTTTITIVYGAPSMSADLAGRRATLQAWHGGQIDVAAAGDVDGDGHADLLVGDVGSSCAPGTVLLLYGGTRLSGTHELRTAGPVIRDDSYCTGFGVPMGLGDLDGDGFDDFAVSARGDSSVATTAYLYVFYGGPERMEGRVSAQEAAALRLRTQDFHTRFGLAAPAGDVNGDGLADFLVARTGDHAHLVLGRRERATGEATIESLGVPLATRSLHAPSGLGDLDGDGMDEIGLASATSDGLTRVLYGRSEWGPLTVEEDADVHLRAGSGCIVLAHAGDVDGDGHRDFLCGASGHRNGAAVLVLGREGRLEGEVDLETEGVWVLGRSLDDATLGTFGDATGHTVLGGRDVNGDGLSDVLIGAPSPYRGGGTYAGTVHLFLGRSR
jgi:hypothetical protein